jgi:hypothetical protein
MTDLPCLETIELSTTEHPAAAVIWMHGLGADGNDFVPIVRELDLSGCPGIRFIFPHAEPMPVTINGGYVMRAWYDILGMDLVRREDETGLRQSQTRIEQLIEREVTRGIPASRPCKPDCATRNNSQVCSVYRAICRLPTQLPKSVTPQISKRLSSLRTAGAMALSRLTEQRLRATCCVNKGMTSSGMTT